MLSLREVIEATGGDIAAEAVSVFSGISIDSRTIRDGEVFLPIKGDRFDGHDFVREALERGAGAIVNSRYRLPDTGFTGRTIILVNDTLSALQDLARYFRNKFDGHVIGIVGSNGKTTTKELVASVLSTRLDVIKTVGNLNNHIGMPLSVVNGAAHEAGNAGRAMVLEMGTNRPGDVEELCNIAAPDIGVVTNIGYEHLEGFGSLERVRESELEIMPYVRTLILNGDDEFLMEGVRNRSRKAEGTVPDLRTEQSGVVESGLSPAARRLRIITFGIENQKADVVARRLVFSDDTTAFTLCAGEDCIEIESKLPGRFNVYNSLAAASAGLLLGFNPDEVKRGLEAFEGVDMRFEIKRYSGATFLNDIYNANPSSMEESLKETARRFREGERRYKRVIAVLGDMLELGDFAEEEHRKLGRRLLELDMDVFVGVGPLMALAVAEFGEKGISIPDSGKAGLELKKMLGESDLVLIKGSRGMKMERVLKTVTGGV